MPFHPPPQSSVNHENKGGPRPHNTAIAVNKLEPTPTLTKTTRGRLASPNKLGKRARSLSFSDTVTVFDSSDDGINEPVTPPPPPPIINHLSRYVKRAKANPKQYLRNGPSAFERRFFNTQLSHSEIMDTEDVQMSNDVLERRLQHLSSEATSQAVLTMHADVEWRRMCALTTAWEIYAREQHLKFLHMVLEDEGQTYASASSEPFHTSLKELIRSSKKEIGDNIDFSVTAYNHDVASFTVGDAQLDYLESAALTYPDSANSSSGDEDCDDPKSR